MTAKYVIGVDESGCGALAGPLFVAAAAFPADAEHPGVTWKSARGANRWIAIGDSKKVKNPEHRAALGYVTRVTAKSYAIIERTAAEIDARLFGTVFPEAVQLALSRCLENLVVMNPGLKPGDVLALVDGDIKKPKAPCEVRLVVGGDATDWRVGAASILAKVAHDEWVARAIERFPTWGFDAHRGYPTRAHKAMLASNGPTPLHRKSYKPVMEASPRAKGIEE